jgi:hypothetical protein
MGFPQPVGAGSPRPYLSKKVEARCLIACYTLLDKRDTLRLPARGLCRHKRFVV